MDTMERPQVDVSHLRLGEKLHREVALRAAEENLSIDQWVVRMLLAEG